MPLKHTTPVLNNDLRARAIAALNDNGLNDFQKVNNCRYGMILTDLDGNERYVQVNIKVTKFNENVTAQETMEAEYNEYLEQLEREKKKEKEKKEKAEKDKAKREKKEKEREG